MTPAASLRPNQERIANAIDKGRIFEEVIETPEAPAAISETPRAPQSPGASESSWQAPPRVGRHAQ